MAMLTSLPNVMYRIELLVGKVGKETRIVIAERSDHRLTLAHFEIVELLPLSVQLVTNHPNVAVKLQLDETMDAIELSSTQPMRTIFQPETDTYPWNCGVFPFEVREDIEIAHSRYEIKPKNINSAQMQLMHETITARVSGLIYNFLNVRQSGIMYMPELEQVSGWHYLNWYQSNEQALMEALNGIERTDEQELAWDYQVESRPRKMNARTLVCGNLYIQQQN